MFTWKSEWYIFRIFRMKKIGLKNFKGVFASEWSSTTRAFCTLPSFARTMRPKWRPLELNDRHVRSHRNLGDRVNSLVSDHSQTADRQPTVGRQTVGRFFPGAVFHHYPGVNRPLSIYLNSAWQWYLKDTHTEEMNKNGHSVSFVCIFQASLSRWILIFRKRSIG